MPRNDADKPLALLTRSAQGGTGWALAALGDRYRNGFGVPKDFLRAIRFYLAARDADEHSAYTFLSVSTASKAGRILKLLDDNLEPKHPLTPEYERFAQVMSPYLKATERKDVSAMCRLGDLCLAGKMTPRNTVAAFRWYALAAKQGHQAAIVARDRTGEMLTKPQLDEALSPGEQKLFSDE